MASGVTEQVCSLDSLSGTSQIELLRMSLEMPPGDISEPAPRDIYPLCSLNLNTFGYTCQVWVFLLLLFLFCFVLFVGFAIFLSCK